MAAAVERSWGADPDRAALRGDVLGDLDRARLNRQDFPDDPQTRRTAERVHALLV